MKSRGGIKCPSCKQEIDNMTVIQCIPFADCITLIRTVGINKDPVSILAMFRDAIGKLQEMS